MSSGSGGEEGARYWCHLCNVLVTPVRGVEEEVSCPQCHGGFVEEIETPQPPQQQRGLEGGRAAAARPVIIAGGGGEDLMSRMAESITAALLDHDQGGGGGGGGAAAAAAPFNPMTILQSYMQNIMGAAVPPTGGNIQIIFDHTGGGGGGGIRLPGGAFGDYYLGAGLEQLIQQLAENDPNRYGTPPAAKAAVEAMPTVNITLDHLNSDAGQCAVCKDTFEEGASARQMPCKHMYHSECILPWLDLHSTCPVCRYEMPTEENPQNLQNPQNPSTAGDPDGDGGGGGRMIRIQLPLPFASPAPPGSSSNQGNSGSALPNDGHGGSGDHSSEARHEDLD
uniref:RING-type E3 ubiquitin transferase n=1 Tax=Araucaria cunninghamii TaxID=56994 RepID=A0A0D6QWC7_ARACU